MVSLIKFIYCGCGSFLLVYKLEAQCSTSTLIKLYWKPNVSILINLNFSHRRQEIKKINHSLNSYI